MPETSLALFEHFRQTHGKDIDLTLRPAYLDLLAAMGDPQLHLPPVIHVAGTNGKGSTCAFLRAFLEEAGLSVHVYTSPHLVRFHERIRVAGKLIEEEEIVALLQEVKAKAPPGGISPFEAAAAAAFAAFARRKADAVILEVGLGGRLDATNVVPKPAACLITRLSFDHRDYLGHTMDAIAREKAGIMREGIPCFVQTQTSQEALDALRDEAAKKGTPLFVEGEAWRVQLREDGVFAYSSSVIQGTRIYQNLPCPALLGGHQYANAALAMAALSALPFTVPEDAVHKGLKSVSWPGRLQQIEGGPLYEALPTGSELWLDGGHNDSAGEVLGLQFARWRKESDRPIHLVTGMLSTKVPEEFFAPLLPYVDRGRTVRVDGEVPGFPADILAARLCAMRGGDILPASSLQDAVTSITHAANAPCRVVVCGSLYLVGRAIKESGVVLG